ncbi:hypothetical protein NMY22_g10435 [Coprinellus aureogranulatus]|nr:hypothetical protein NMY22_g10435 [Coprinellus aureogranulatus]
MPPKKKLKRNLAGLRNQNQATAPAEDSDDASTELNRKEPAAATSCQAEATEPTLTDRAPSTPRSDDYGETTCTGPSCALDGCLCTPQQGAQLTVLLLPSPVPLHIAQRSGAHVWHQTQLP